MNFIRAEARALSNPNPQPAMEELRCEIFGDQIRQTKSGCCFVKVCKRSNNDTRFETINTENDTVLTICCHDMLAQIAHGQFAIQKIGTTSDLLPPRFPPLLDSIDGFLALLRGSKGGNVRIRMCIHESTDVPE